MGEKIYLVVWNDRHADPGYYAFVREDDAVKKAEEIIESLDSDFEFNLEDYFTDAILPEGWLWYHQYSPEDDFVVVREVQFKR